MTAGHESPQGRSPRDEPSDPAAFAEVFNRFTLNSGRRRGNRHAESSSDSSPGKFPSSQEPMTETPWPSAEPLGHGRPVAPPQPTGEEPATYIRPYAWTGGRTKSNHALELETLVSTSELCRTARLERLEHHSIASLCQHPRSVAEVGAMLHVPLGVTRVLLGDMADLGLITVHQTVSENGSASHFNLMERVLSGLRRL